MIRTCFFDRFQALHLPLVVMSVAIVLLTSICSPLLLRIQPQTPSTGPQSIAQLDGLEDAAILHKTDDTSPKACNLLVIFDAETLYKDNLLTEYSPPYFAAAVPLSAHLIYTQTVSEHL